MKPIISKTRATKAPSKIRRTGMAIGSATMASMANQITFFAFLTS
ncbi:MAG: hypothetical protein WA036_01305 [Streptococcus suis]